MFHENKESRVNRFQGSLRIQVRARRFHRANINMRLYYNSIHFYFCVIDNLSVGPDLIKKYYVITA